MSATPAFGTQLIGQTEKALNGILVRLLEETGLTEPLWVTLAVAVMTDGTLTRDQFATRLAGAVSVSEAEARTRIDGLAAAALIDVPAAGDRPVEVTEAGRQLQARIREQVQEITERLWGDLPADDLAVAGRVLATVQQRASTEFASLEK